MIDVYHRYLCNVSLSLPNNVGRLIVFAMKFCPIVPEICRGQVHVPKKERQEKENNNNNNKKRSKNNKSPKLCLGDLIIIMIIIIIIRNGANTISH
jgi:hypothetical protein